jgi:hypothetical protein
MNKSIKIKESIINLDFSTQFDKNKRPFRLSGTRMNLQLPPKWIEKNIKYHWIHSFKYLDEKGGYFEIEIDYNDNFFKI